MYVAVIALALADFGVDSQQIWRLQHISATTGAPNRRFGRECLPADNIGCSPAGWLADVSTSQSSYG